MKSKEETTERKLRVVFCAEDVRSMMSVAIGRCDQIIKSLEGSSDPEDKDEIRSCEFLIAACGFVFGSKDAWVVLYSVLVLAAEEEEDLEFQIDSRAPPTNPEFACPLLVLCDYPAFTKICVEGLPCNVNTHAPKLCPGTTPVHVSTWSQVKALFR